jgi:putative GTP pyrophosphokinase
MEDTAAKKLTVSQLNKIGDRLRKNMASDDDLRLLDTFRLSFTAAYERVFDELSKLGLNPWGSPQKTTLSIVAKLNREKTRLSRMQDIAGCRVEVQNLMEQDRVVHELKTKFLDASIHDRRVKSSHGYRAVHVIVVIEERPVEIQVRTPLQHSWASATEKLSDVLDPEIKYGGGPEGIQKQLAYISDLFANYETAEVVHSQVRALIEHLSNETDRIDEELAKNIEQDEKYAAMLKEIREQGGVTNYVEKLELQLKNMREGMNAKLTGFCKLFNIDV